MLANSVSLPYGTIIATDATSGAAAVVQDDAEAIAIQALSFIASDPELLPRFLAITGIEAPQVRQAAREPGFLAGVLQFLLAHEPTLMAFSEANSLAPREVAAAHRALPFGQADWDIQP